MPDPERKAKATYDDLLQAPPHLVAELLDGDLVLSPRPAPRHALASSEIGGSLIHPFGRPGGRGRGGPGGWWILFEPELHLGQDVVVPDLAGWRRERLPTLPKQPHFDLAPDWVCEVISPRTAGHDRVQKMHIYARERVPNVWLVDPIGRTLEVYRSDGGRWILISTHADADEVRAEPFDAIELALRDWWVPEPDEEPTPDEDPAPAPVPTPETP
jgi:Uma2 family endonuclease